MVRYRTSAQVIEEIDDAVLYNDTYIFVIAVQTNSRNALLFTYDIEDDSWGQTYELSSRYGTFIYRPNVDL